ncbi:MAG: lamin tail domain-containing protein [bacterium]|nr:lamin tail domain-containing protein [bacterium]
MWLFLAVCLFLPAEVLASQPLSVVFNEIAWMGTTASANNEWIELYNNTNTEINLAGWGLYEEGEKTLVEPLIGIIGAKSYYLVERTDDNTVPGIKASQSPTGWGGYGLNNNGEHLQLLDNSSNIIDEVDYSGGWFTGIGKPEYKTMERINSLVGGSDPQNWQTSQNPGGTPKVKNSEQNQELKIAEDVFPLTSLTKSEKPAVDDSRQRTYPSGIVINEILPSPEGPDETEEWIEIFNQNSFPVELSGWQINDFFGKTKTYSFPPGTVINPQSYLVVKRPDSKIILNNQEEKIFLSAPDKRIIDTVYYKKAVREQSLARFSND